MAFSLCWFLLVGWLLSLVGLVVFLFVFDLVFDVVVAVLLLALILVSRKWRNVLVAAVFPLTCALRSGHLHRSSAPRSLGSAMAYLQLKQKHLAKAQTALAW